jgi:hypothetical protein
MPIRRPYRPPSAPERSLDEDEDPSISGEYRMIYGRTPRALARHGPIDAGPQSQGRMLDDELAFDLDDALDLDIPLLEAAPRSSRSYEQEAPRSTPLGHGQRPGPSSWREPPAPPSSRQQLVAQPAHHAHHAPQAPPTSRASSPQHDPMRRSSPEHTALAQPAHVPDAHDRIVAFAGFGEPPTSVWSSPAYALHVMRRKRKLSEQLAIARLHHSPDVPVYEAALRTADEAAARRGLVAAAGIAVLVVMTVTALYEIIHVALEVHS